MQCVLSGSSSLQHWPQISRRMATWKSCDLLRRTSSDEIAASFATFRSQIDDPIGALDHLQIVFNHDHRITRVAQLHQHLQQFLNVGEMQSGRRLIENVKGAPSRLFRKLCSEFYALGFPAGESGSALAKSQITETYIEQ